MTHTVGLLRVAMPEQLLELATLRTLYPGADAISRESLGARGYSGATLERIEVRLTDGRQQRLILKRFCPADDWTAYRSEDGFGRQAMVLNEPQLRGIWDILRCPYVACAMADGEVGLLMDDLTPWLVPDVDEPLTEEAEDRLLGALAAVHARYWESEVLQLDWLARPRQILRVLGPDAPQLYADRPLEPLFELVRDGWAAALGLLPEPAALLLSRRADALVDQFAYQLPRTLLHGDAKVANFALLPTGVAALDWSWVGAGPCTLDLGWYLAVNAGRLARPREAVVRRYRVLLERALGIELPDEQWSGLVTFGVLAGACMLLWQKALGYQSGSARAAEEWAWWVSALERIEAAADAGL